MNNRTMEYGWRENNKQDNDRLRVKHIKIV